LLVLQQQGAAVRRCQPSGLQSDRGRQGSRLVTQQLSILDEPDSYELPKSSTLASAGLGRHGARSCSGPGMLPPAVALGAMGASVRSSGRWTPPEENPGSQSRISKHDEHS
jgi:hypothetical protein